MTTLTETLNRVMNWLERFQPEQAESFLPGLSRMEIYETFSEFGLVVPEELYELYQWKNGRSIDLAGEGVFVPSIYEFLPLNKAIETSLAFNQIEIPNDMFAKSIYDLFTIEESEEMSLSEIDLVPLDEITNDACRYLNKFLFHFLGYSDPEFCVLPLSEFQEDSYPVMVVYEGEEPEIYCSSLTSMMLIIAEAYESGVYQEDLYEIDDREYIKQKEKEMKAIEEKYRYY